MTHSNPLPKLGIPKYKVTIPSTNETIDIRPLLVGEEKILLMASDSKDDAEIAQAILQVVEACTLGQVDVKTLKQIDIEWLFMTIRRKSMGDTIEVTVPTKSTLDEHAGKRVDVLIDFKDASIKNEDAKISENFILDEETGTGIKLVRPNYVDIISLHTRENMSPLEVLALHVESIFTKEDVWLTKDIGIEAVSEWCSQLTSMQLSEIQPFFDVSPKLTLEVKYFDPYTEKEETLLLEDIMDFFI